VKFKVTDEQRANGEVRYTIAESGNTIGTVTANTCTGTWKCTAATGLLVTDINVRKRMYAAVRVHERSTTLSGETAN
jgi:hypothetical protein